jgi:hypothetical protein
LSTPGPPHLRRNETDALGNKDSATSRRMWRRGNHFKDRGAVKSPDGVSPLEKLIRARDSRRAGVSLASWAPLNFNFWLNLIDGGIHIKFLSCTAKSQTYAPKGMNPAIEHFTGTRQI